MPSIGNHLEADILKADLTGLTTRVTGEAAVKVADRLVQIIKDLLGHPGGGKPAPIGQPPNRQTGALQTGISVVSTREGYVVEMEVKSRVDYGKGFKRE